MSLPLWITHERREQVLVVDDEPLILDGLELLLSDCFDVLVAGSAAEAKGILQQEEVAVLVSDSRMPGESGVELLRWSYENCPDTIRILLTGYTDLEMVLEAVNKGKVWHYVQKPWDANALMLLLQRATEYRNKDLEVRQRYEGSIRSLVAALEASHPYSSGHSTRVTGYCRIMSDALTLGGRERDQLVLAAQLHDIGKIGVAGNYLDKSGPLTDEEWARIRSHVEVGRRILESTGFLDNVVPFVVTHHERWDGRGYPAGLVGEEIPFGGRIICIADAFDAMTSHRAYRRAMPTAAALYELQRCAGTQFDPDLTGVFCRAVEELEKGRLGMAVGGMLKAAASM